MYLLKNPAKSLKGRYQTSPLQMANEFLSQNGQFFTRRYSSRNKLEYQHLDPKIIKKIGMNKRLLLENPASP
jgi:hypothetical protein